MDILCYMINLDSPILRDTIHLHIQLEPLRSTQPECRHVGLIASLGTAPGNTIHFVDKMMIEQDYSNMID